MKHAETVTFGGSGLDRRAELRGDAAQLAQLSEGAQARHFPFWRGKPLIDGAARDRLGWAGFGEAVLGHATATPVFLGFDGDAPCFAHDISAWEPPDVDPATLGAFYDPSEQHYPGLPDEARFAELRGAMVGLSPRDAELAATAKAVLGWHVIHRFCARCGQETVIAQGGWQRDCPACGGHHFPRTDPVVIMLITNGNSTLIGRSPGWPEGMYSCLAGFVEPGETIEAAVRREVFEEAGVRVGPVRYLASQPWAFPSSLMFGCHGEAISTQLTIDPNEIEEALWISREDILTVFSGTHPRIKPARKGAIARFLLENWLADSLD